MPGKYWIKLYHEMLYDRKVASLDDRLWRRVVECFLLAGELNDGGYLPSLEDMAWAFRVDEEQIETELNELIRLGILEFKDERYFVRKFSDRQKAMPKAEYMRRKREEAKAGEHYKSLPPRYQSVTDSNTDIDTDIDTDVDKRIDIDGEEPNPDGIYADLSIAFCNKTSIPELHGGPEAWYDSLTRMGEAGVIPEDIENAVDILRDKEYSIIRLSSVENTAIGEMSKRLGKHERELTPEKIREKYAGGEYADFIET
jgi:hypothetical protein